MRLRPARTFAVESALPDALAPLATIARNLYWTWNTDARALFERVDPAVWEEVGHNPVALVQYAEPARLNALATDGDFLEHLMRVEAALRGYRDRTPVLNVTDRSNNEVIAYFSLEFALTESLPTYSGGLGVLAGDHLKSASDLGLPLIGVGLLYHEGYFHQALGPDGWQEERYSPIDLGSQPLRLLRDDAGEPLAVSVPFAGRAVRAVLWQLDVGNVPLILLDSNVDGNSGDDRAICSRLYGGDFEMRIQQEMLLGIGGVRAVRAVGLHASVCHMNEGHSALLGLERIRTLMEEAGASFEEARLPVTAATVFTTHTAVAAGIDLFSPDLVRRHLGHYYEAMGLDEHTFIGFGRTNPHDDYEPFSMALLGLRFSGFRNGVSRLHRSVSQNLWESAWPNVPSAEVPIDSVTNGVHLPTWVAHEMGNLYDGVMGPAWRDDPTSAENWESVRNIPDEALWDARECQRKRLVQRANQQARESSARRAGLLAAFERAPLLDPRALTIGFGRRFAGYKRATLLFRDRGRLAALLNNRDRPVQFVFSGKAHPRDEPAKQLIREVLQFSRLPEFGGRVVLLEGYDVDLARALVQGCDVWLNTPLRPLEASGTSGMKAVANGALHLSVKDGWWWEGFRPGLGWSIGNDRLDDDPEVQDALDSASLYDTLEAEVVPLFYDRDEAGLPREWLRRMKGSIAAYAPVFNTSRMVAEYAQKAYAPAAERWHALRADGLRTSREQSAWLAHVRARWDRVQVISISDDAEEPLRSDTTVRVRVRIEAPGLAASDLKVELISGRMSPSGELYEDGLVTAQPVSEQEESVFDFEALYRPERGGRRGYAVRITPQHEGLHDSLSTGMVLWS